MIETEGSGIKLQVTDVSGQKIKTVSGLDPEMSVGEFIEAMVKEMNLPPNENSYTARLEREGRHLHASELVGDALHDEDRIELHPDISAG